eukprot:750905-Hanusia_phi.AAC.1
MARDGEPLDLSSIKRLSALLTALWKKDARSSQVSLQHPEAAQAHTEIYESGVECTLFDWQAATLVAEPAAGCIQLPISAYEGSPCSDTRLSVLPAATWDQSNLSAGFNLSSLLACDVQLRAASPSRSRPSLPLSQPDPLTTVRDPWYVGWQRTRPPRTDHGRGCPRTLEDPLFHFSYPIRGKVTIRLSRDTQI